MGADTILFYIYRLFIDNLNLTSNEFFCINLLNYTNYECQVSTP